MLENNENKIHIVSDENIKNILWNDIASDERLRTFIRRFRNKTSKDLIKNVKGKGYQITIVK